ncbi:hypothetical protein WG901_21790 [Novosphingobium sp. PS1R-30]|uniref:Uncharacterized protein n=1 Tax=Novosphingobium anseongense TaxID=3133436 RepID=A0ABU8S1Q0_9SPHN
MTSATKEEHLKPPTVAPHYTYGSAAGKHGDVWPCRKLTFAAIGNGM